ncbi:MAG: MFS transporter [Pseudomonadota bacterium]
MSRSIAAEKLRLETSLRNLKIYMSAQVMDLHGLWIHRVALGWLTWTETESEFWVGMIAFAQFFPVVVLGPLFGVLADRMDRRRAAMALVAVLMVIAALMTITSLAGVLDIWVILALSLATGVAAGAYSPIRMSLVANLLARAHLARGIAINSLAFNASRFLGPMLAGLIIVTWGPALAFALNTLSYLVMLLALANVRPLVRPRDSEARGDILDELFSGLRYALDHPLIRSLLWLAMAVAVFGRGVMEMLPAFADGVFGRGAPGLAWLTSAGGAGAICAGVWVLRGGQRVLQVTAPVSALLGGLLVSVFGVTPSFWLGLVLVAALGFCFSCFGISVQSLLQVHVDEDYRGRVSSFWGVFGIGGSAFGAFLLGAVAPAVGLKAVTVASGILCVALCLATSLRVLKQKSPA